MNEIPFPVAADPREPKFVVSLSWLKSAQDLLQKGSISPTNASWACGAVFTAIEFVIQKGDIEE